MGRENERERQGEREGGRERERGRENERGREREREREEERVVECFLWTGGCCCSLGRLGTDLSCSIPYFHGC